MRIGSLFTGCGGLDAAALHHGDALAVLRTLPDASVDAIVTDPPYGLAEHKPATITAALVAWTSGDREHVPDGKGFMGRAWDAFVPPPAVWDECLRVLKPGGYLPCFAGSRTADLMGISIRLAGFEIRDTITWHYGSGFPKSLDVSKAIDKAAGAERQVIGVHHRHGGGSASSGSMSGDLGTASELPLTAPATDAARQWSGWGTALKPASEPIIVARKPLDGTVAATVLAHGTGALNIDGCRVGRAAGDRTEYGRDRHLPHANTTASLGVFAEVTPYVPAPAGRWPTNVVFAHAPGCGPDEAPGPCVDGCPVAELDAGSGASRFFPTFRYQAKAPTAERPKVDGVAHPTVKPLALMRWLVRLVTPPGGTVLDPFAGSGTTLQAARDEGFAAVGIERAAEYLPLIAHRLGDGLEVVEHVEPEPAPEPVESVDEVLVAIEQAGDRAALAALWAEHGQRWSDEHRALATERWAAVPDAA